MKPLLEVSHLDKQIGTLHLQDISFTLEPGIYLRTDRAQRIWQDFPAPHDPESVP